MIKECKECHILFEGHGNCDYCSDCSFYRREVKMKIYRRKYEQKNAYNRNLGNKAQDKAILKFLRGKNAQEDARYREKGAKSI